MGESAAETKAKIIESAKKEFLDKGFIGANLRTIATNAGVTTGAMYRHFKDKDALFCALVDEAIEVTTKTVMMADVNTHSQFAPPASQEHHEEEQKAVKDLLDYLYANFDTFVLLFTKAAGSTHENFLNEICDLYTKNCETTFNWMYEQKIAPKQIDSMTVHFIASTLINAFAEIVFHKINRKEALQYIENMTEFFHFGTLHMMGIACE